MLDIPSRRPSERGARTVAVIGFVDALGTGLFLPLSVIYMTRVVRLSPTAVGLGLTLAGVAGIAMTPACAVLMRHITPRSIVGGCFAVSAAGFVAYTQVNSFAAFLAVAVVVQCASRLERPATAVLVLETNRRSNSVVALGSRQALRNAGYGLGGLLAAVALLIPGRAPFDAALLANALSYVTAGLLLTRLPSPRVSADGRGTLRQVVRDRRFTALAALNTLISLHDSILRVAMPLWIVSRTHAPAALAGVLFALNTVLVVVAQLPISRAVAKHHGIGRSYAIAAAMFCGCGVAFALAAGASTEVAIALLVLGLTAQTWAELENTAGEAFLSVELAPPDLRGQYIGLFKTSMGVQQAIGPIVVTVAIVHFGRLGWVLLAAMTTAATLISRSLTAGAPIPGTRRPATAANADPDELRDRPLMPPCGDAVAEAPGRP
ncbi:MAG TPA: MFS transporter [Streptosporangiaceae bacterium]|nr:MFS transporter [Streptosporangiaceae bacterium]